MNDDLLIPMYDDEYYDNTLVNKIKDVLIDFSKEIEKMAKTQDIYNFAHAAIQKINRLKPLFEERECSLDDVAADYISEAFMMILEDRGYFDIDVQELMAYKEF